MNFFTKRVKLSDSTYIKLQSLSIAYEYKPRVTHNHVFTFARIFAHTEELDYSFTFQ